MTHPDEMHLALFAGDDLPFLERWRTSRHVRNCGQCTAEVRALQGASEAVREAVAGMPAGVAWNSLSEEMRGNIHVGLAAGECVRPFVDRSRRPVWAMAAAVCGAAAIMLTAMWLNFPREHTDPLVASLRALSGARAVESVVLEASPGAIALTENGGSISLLSKHSDAVAVSMDMQGSANTRFVDSDTGQVTINRVSYAQ